MRARAGTDRHNQYAREHEEYTSRLWAVLGRLGLQACDGVSITKSIGHGKIAVMVLGNFQTFNQKFNELCGHDNGGILATHTDRGLPSRFVSSSMGWLKNVLDNAGIRLQGAVMVVDVRNWKDDVRGGGGGKLRHGDGDSIDEDGRLACHGSRTLASPEDHAAVSALQLENLESAESFAVRYGENGGRPWSSSLGGRR